MIYLYSIIEGLFFTDFFSHSHKMIYFSIPPTILPTKLSEPEFAVVCSGPFDDGLTVPFMVGATRTLPVPR